MSDDFDYIDHQIAQGIEASHYIVGKAKADDAGPADSHTHDLYLRDDLPIATSNAQVGTGIKGWHAHSITTNSTGELICQPAGPDNHIHTTIKLVKAGNKIPKDDY